MAKQKKLKNDIVCGDCEHFFACKTWNLGNLENTDASHCANYEKDDKWWHKTSVSQPEIYENKYRELIPFLVCCKGTEYPFRAFYDGTNWRDGINTLDVTHWMPLPEPPKEEN